MKQQTFRTFILFWMTQSISQLGRHPSVWCIAGSGMAVMFLCTGILGSLTRILAYKHKEVQELKNQNW